MLKSISGESASAPSYRRKNSPRFSRAVSMVLEAMESRRMLAGVVISEFMADNDTGIRDYYNQNSDWIELRNTDATPRNISGWHLTDKTDDLDQYTFPAGTVIPANGHLIVWATGRGTVAANGERHTNFGLGAGGEYLGLYDNNLVVQSEYNPEYPQQYADVSYGLAGQTSAATLIGPQAPIKWRVPTSAGQLAANWNTPGFNDASWTSGTTGIGYDSAAPLPALPGANGAYGQFGTGNTWNYYEVVTTTASWSNAQTAAAAKSFMGVAGRLVSIQSANENAFVRSLAAGAGLTQTWIGLTNDGAFGGTDSGNTGGQPLPSNGSVPTNGQRGFGYVWSSGEPFNYHSSWEAGQPSNSGGGGREYVRMAASNGTWNDRGGGETNAYMIEYPLNMAIPAGQPNFAVREVKSATPVTNIQDAINLIEGDGGTIVDYSAATINFVDPQSNGGGGNFGGDANFGGNTGAADDNFALRIRGTIRILNGGQYTFGINSDDGFSLKINGATFTALTNCTNATGSDTMVFANGRASANSLGTANLAAGDYELELVYFENGGGAQVEFSAAAGVKTAFDSDFKLVGDTVNGGLPLLSVADNLASNPTFKTAAQNNNASAFMRIPFNLASTANIAGLKLRLKFDDGFVAFLNGQEVADVNAPASRQWNSTATADVLTGEAVRYVEFDLTDDLGLLVSGQNVLAIHMLNSSAADSNMLALPVLEMVTQSGASQEGRYFTTPTPGAANGSGVADLGPIVSDVSVPSVQPGDGDDIVVTAKVRAATNPVAGAPTLFYRVMYNAEQNVPMWDDGLGGGHGDAVAGDGTWTGIIPASASTAGQMVRWYVRAMDTVGNAGRWPVIVPVVGNDAGPEYEGTVIKDPGVSSTLPVFEWFVQNPSAADTRTGTRGSAYFLGEFYDNIYIRYRGAGTVGGNKFKFNSGYDFKYAEDQPRVNEFNLNNKGSRDDAYIRPVISFETFRDVGTPAEVSFPMRIQRNGSYQKVAIFIEQPEEGMLEREGWYEDGSLYKLTSDHPTMTNANTFEKKTREEESRADLQDFLAGIHLTGAAKTRYLYDNVNIPVMINYIVANQLVNDNDDAQKNYYLYRDTNDGASTFYQGANAKGTNEWSMLPWDKDLTFGKHYFHADYQAVDPQTHPFFGDSEHPKADGPGAWNWLIDSVLDVPEFKQMYLRRLRTAMDEFLQPLGVPAADRYYEQRLDELFAQLSGDSQIAGSLGDITSAFNNLKTQYLDKRRVHFYINHSVNTAYPDFAGIPAEQKGTPAINFGAYDASPASGDQDHEFLTLTNPNSVAVDISGWRLAGGVDYTFEKGVVIPAGGTLYVSPNVFAFRSRPGRSPTALEFVQGNYDGHLSRRGEAVTLTDPHGKVLATLTTANAPSQQQQALRITEVMYHPEAPAAGSQYDDSDFEFIEVKNVSGSTVSLNGVKFTDGVTFDFTGSNVSSLAAGGYALVVANLAAFQSRYGNAFDGIIAGQFAVSPGQTEPSRLDNAGEDIRLADSSGETIHSFDYADGWYRQTDGPGNSLVIRNASAAVNTWGSESSWAASSAPGGSPGAGDTIALSHQAIVVNEIQSNTAVDPNGKWVELRNLTGSAIDIGGWYLSDDNDNLKKYEIPAGTIVPANGYFTLTQNGHFGAAVDLAAGGGEIYLTSASGGALSAFAASEQYRATAPEVTQGRYLTSSQEKDFVPMASATFNAANAAPAVGPVVISEVMFHPASGGDEYVELRNTTGAAVDISAWRITEGIDFQFPAGASIPANGYALIVKVAPSFFRAKYAIPAAVPIFGLFENGMDNDGDEIELRRPIAPGGPYMRVDQVKYSDQAPWPVTADGQGASLDRISNSAYGDDVANWQAGRGTPGAGFIAFDTTPPSVPINVSKTVVNANQTNITWSASGDAQSGIAFYYVYVDGKRMAASTTTSFSDTYSTNGASRTYQISAVNGDGIESFLSGTVASASISSVAPDPRNNAVNSITITFTGPVTGFNLADLSLRRNGGANLLTGAQTLITTDNINWTLNNLSGITGTAGSYTLLLTAAGSGILVDGQALAGDASDTWAVDQAAPTAAITPVSPDPRVTAVDQIQIVFSEPVTNLDLADLTLKRNNGANLLTASQTLSTADNITWTLGNLGGLTYIQGTYQLDLASGSVLDLAGNAIGVGASESWGMSVTAQTPFDTTDDQTGTITAQGENGTGEGRAKAFDNTSSTKWLDFAQANPNTRASWIQYQYASGNKFVVTQYTITSANDAPERDPRDWELLGSNDGGQTWVVLDSQVNQTFSARFDKKSYSFANSTAFNVYRLNILSVANPGGANSVQLAEIELIGLPPLPPPVVNSVAREDVIGRIISVSFSSNVGASIGVDDIEIKNLTTNQTVAATGVTYDAQTNTAVFTLPASLANGNYTATLLSSGISDGGGQALDGDNNNQPGGNYVHSFFQLTGDANGDRTVDHLDFNILYANFGATSAGPALGNFNADGVVNFADFQIIERAMGNSLPAPAAPVGPASPALPTPTTQKPKPAIKPSVIAAKPAPATKPAAAKPAPAQVAPPKVAVFNSVKRVKWL